MANLLIIKLALASTTALGGSTIATYFGTRTTVEDFIKKENKDNQSLKRRDNWSEYKNSLISTSSDNPDNPDNPIFSKIKENNWEGIEAKCSEIYSWTYKALWITYIDMSNNLKENIQKYCFTS